jgi:hypothetical protein
LNHEVEIVLQRPRRKVRVGQTEAKFASGSGRYLVAQPLPRRSKLPGRIIPGIEKFKFQRWFR